MDSFDLDQPETREIAGGDTPQTDRSVAVAGMQHPGARYPGLGRRLVAWCVDIVFASGLFCVVLVLLSLTGVDITFVASAPRLWGTAALIAYMTIAAVLYHCSVGKYLLGMEVVAEDEGPARWRQLVLRETIGRLGILVFACGYWRAGSDIRRRAWCDNLSDTVVVRRKRTPGVIAIVGVAALLSLLAFGWAIYLKEITPVLTAEVNEDFANFNADWTAIQTEIKQYKSGQSLATLGQALESESDQASTAGERLLDMRLRIRRLLWYVPTERKKIDGAIAMNKLRLRQIAIYRREGEIMVQLGNAHQNAAADRQQRSDRIEALKGLDRNLQMLDRQVEELRKSR